MEQALALAQRLWASDDAAACLRDHLQALCAHLGIAAARVHAMASRQISLRSALAIAETGPTEGMAGSIEIALECGPRLVGVLVFHDPRPTLALDAAATELLAVLAPPLAVRVDHAAHLRRNQTIRDFSARVSHETNNPLAVVVANLDYLDHFVESIESLVAPAELEQVRGAIDDSRSAAVRLRHLSQRLTRFTPSHGVSALAPDDPPIVRSEET